MPLALEFHKMLHILRIYVCWRELSLAQGKWMPLQGLAYYLWNKSLNQELLWKDNWTNQYENELKNMEFWASESEWNEFVNTVWILPCFFMTMPKISLQRKSKKYCWQLWNKQSNIFKRFSGNKLNRRYQIILPVVLLYNISIHF